MSKTILTTKELLEELRDSLNRFFKNYSEEEINKLSKAEALKLLYAFDDIEFELRKP